MANEKRNFEYKIFPITGSNEKYGFDLYGKPFFEKVARSTKRGADEYIRHKWSYQKTGKYYMIEFEGSEPIKTRSPKIGTMKKTTQKLIPEHKKYFNPLTKLQAKNFKMNQNKEVFGLRLDGSESLIVFNKDFENPEFYAFGYEKNIGTTKKMGVIKKTSATKSKKMGLHKDTNSHNVRIKVVSGTKKKITTKKTTTKTKPKTTFTI
jgi:hypothetical protein